MCWYWVKTVIVSDDIELPFEGILDYLKVSALFIIDASSFGVF